MDLEFRLEILEQTLANIKQIDSDKGRNIMAEYSDFVDDFHQLVVGAKSIRLLLEKAEQYYFDDKKILEMNLLFNAYCKIKAGNLSNKDLSTVSLVNYATGKPLTLDGIEQRLTTLGWKG